MRAIRRARPGSLGRFLPTGTNHRDGMDKFRDNVGTKVPLFLSACEKIGPVFLSQNLSHRKLLRCSLLLLARPQGARNSWPFACNFASWGNLSPLCGREEHGS